MEYLLKQHDWLKWTAYISYQVFTHHQLLETLYLLEFLSGRYNVCIVSWPFVWEGVMSLGGEQFDKRAERDWKSLNPFMCAYLEQGALFEERPASSCLYKGLFRQRSSCSEWFILCAYSAMDIELRGTCTSTYVNRPLSAASYAKLTGVKKVLGGEDCPAHFSDDHGNVPLEGHRRLSSVLPDCHCANCLHTANLLFTCLHI